MSTSQIIDMELESGERLAFEIKRDDYVKFVNSALKNPFNAQQNLLVSTVVAANKEALNALLDNPANVTELCGALLEDYKPDVAVAVKKRRTSLTA